VGYAGRHMFGDRLRIHGVLSGPARCSPWGGLGAGAFIGSSPSTLLAAMNLRIAIELAIDAHEERKQFFASYGGVVYVQCTRVASQSSYAASLNRCDFEQVL
jgi:hypothetical protein